MADFDQTAVTLVAADTGDGRLAPDSGTPAQIGRYLVLGVLGRGGMGVVFSCYDEQLRRRVALKQIGRPGADAPARQRSLREAQALARLAHPNIVAVHEALEVDSRLYIVMELVAGQTLREWLKQVRPRRDERLAALIQAGRGIAAAHAAGLVHRDLKPDNIMLGDDGRVRVMDFGLARAVDSEPETLELETAQAHQTDLSSTATYTGVFVGTPGYVSPEQRLGVAADARSDIFSFCVLAFEALHDRRPFPDHDADALAAVLAGNIAAVDDDVPAWLDAVLRRGMAASPEARWPSMDALLDAIADDPLARARRRWRALAWFTLAGLVAAGITYGVSRWFEAAERARREQAASTRLGAVEVAISRAEAEGDLASAEAAFRAFIADPAHRHTRALARAWLDRGDRRKADTTAARAAYAEGYVYAQTIDDEREALLRLAGTFTRELDGVGLRCAVDLLRDRGADDLALAELAFQADLWTGDLPAAAAELARDGHPSAAWRTTLDHLARATTSPTTVGRLAQLPGEPTRFAARDPAGTHVVQLGPDLRVLDRWTTEGRIDLIPGTSWALSQTASEAQITDLVSRTVLARGPTNIAYALPFDATGDGTPELFLGHLWPLYGFVRWDLGRGALDVRPAHPATDAGNSVFEAHAVADLDGDGRDELAIGFGPWRRFDLRVFRPDARGELELVAERRTGRVGGLSLVHRDGRPLLAAVVDDSCPAPDVFPEPPHVGGPPGLHLFALEGGALVSAGHTPFPHGDDFRGFVVHDSDVVGDLDGDGRDDLAFPLSRSGKPWLLLLRQTDAGFEPLLLAGVSLLAAAQLDADAPLELLTARWPEADLLALGLGDAPAPAPERPTVAAPPLPPPLLADPWLAERWNRASDLAALSLSGSAGESLRDAALMIADLPSKSALLDRAGELFAGQDRVFDVLALEHEVHEDWQVRGRAELRRIQALSRLGRHQEALAEADALLRAPVRDAESVRVAAALAADLSRLLARDAQVDLRFDVPLVDAWQIHTPGALRRRPARAVLEVASPALGAPVAELPIEWDGGPIALEVELDVERLEFGASLAISLAAPDGTQWLGVALSGQGGGGRLQQVPWARAGGTGWAQLGEDQVASGLHRRRLTATVTYFPATLTADLMLDKGDEVRIRRIDVVTPPAPGRHRLQIGSFGDSRVSSLATGELRRLVVRGARLGAPDPAEVARDRPARLLAEHEPRAALTAAESTAPPTPGAAMVRLLALAELGDLPALPEAARAALAPIDDLRRRGELVLALRRQPLAAAALRAAGGAALLPVLKPTWAFARPHRNDLQLRDELLDGLQELEHLTPTNPAETAALRDLLETRALLQQHSGQPERARIDRELAAALAPPPD